MNSNYGLRENLAIIFRYKSRIKLVFFATVLISLIGSFLVSKVYEADAKILVSNHREAKIVTTSNAPLGVISSDSKEKLTSEMEIFTSFAVLEKTVLKLGTDTVLESMRWRWDWLRELPGKVKETIYKQLWSFPPTETMLLWMGKTPEKEGDKAIVAMAKILDNLTLEPVRGSNVFAVVFETPDPDFAAVVVNTLIEMYQEVHLNLRQGVGESQVFSDQVSRLKQELREAKKKLLQLKHENGIISVDSQIRLLLDRMSANQTQIQDSQLQKSEIELEVAELKRQLSKQPKVIYLEKSWSRNPVVDALTKKLSALKSEQSLYIENSSAAVRLNAEIESIKQRINNEVASVQDTNKSGINPVYQEIQKDLSLGDKKLQGLQNSYAELEKKQQEFERRLEQLDNKRILINERKLEIESKEQSLRLYTKKQEENKINSILNRNKISSIIPIEFAVPPISASRPSKIKNIIIGIIVGLSGGLLIAYISEFLRRSLSNKEEVESFFNYPCLAAFRLFTEQQDNEIDIHNQFQAKMLGESVRQIQRKKNLNSILISSTRPGEGKSTIASKLAESLIKKGSKVLLLNKNQILNSHSDFDQDKQNSDQAVSPEDSFLPLGNSSLLFTINDKNSLANSTQINTMYDFEIFLGRIKESFDFIIVDAPCIQDAPEIMSLSTVIDTVIFVVEAENTSRISVAKALSHLKQAGATISGIVLNKRTFIIPDWTYNWLLLFNKI